MRKVPFGRYAVLLTAAFTMAFTAVGATAAYSQQGQDLPQSVKVRILGINDFHGNLEPLALSSTEPRKVGGAAYLDAYLDKYEDNNPENTIRVHAGDMVGASPLISSYFHDEPTIMVTNRMGLDVGTLGNHEFDEGGEEMLRLINGGQRNDGEQFKTGPNGEQVNTSKPGYPGANYPYIAANTVYKRNGNTVLPPYQIVKRGGVKVGFIGVTTLETPSIVVPDAVAPFDYLDISTTVNKYTKELRSRGVKTVVVLAHAGGVQTSEEEATGEIVDETRQMSDGVDVVVAGHTHSPLNLNVDGKLLVESYPFGTAFEAVDLRISRKNGDVISKDAKLVRTFNSNITPTAKIADFVAKYKERITPVSERVVGNAPEPLTAPRNQNPPSPDGESNLGNLIADAQRQQAGADIAFMNPGGIRADIAAGEVTFGELFTVQPFDNGLSSGELTGDEIYQILEQQFPPTQAAGTRKILQVSGIEVVYDESKPAGERIISVTLDNGDPLDRNATYTVAANSFLITGGDGFTVFKQARNVQSFGTDLEALEGYITEVLNGRIVEPEDNDRLTKQG